MQTMTTVPFGRNEFRCLSNTLTQRCTNLRLKSTLAIVKETRELAQKFARTRQCTEAALAAEIVRIELHQCPQNTGRVDYHLSIWLADGSCAQEEFGGSGLTVPHAIHVLYDRLRDGTLEYLRLVH